MADTSADKKNVTITPELARELKERRDRNIANALRFLSRSSPEIPDDFIREAILDNKKPQQAWQAQQDAREFVFPPLQDEPRAVAEPQSAVASDIDNKSSAEEEHRRLQEERRQDRIAKTFEERTLNSAFNSAFASQQFDPLQPSLEPAPAAVVEPQVAIPSAQAAASFADAHEQQAAVCKDTEVKSQLSPAEVVKGIYNAGVGVVNAGVGVVKRVVSSTGLLRSNQSAVQPSHDIVVVPEEEKMRTVKISDIPFGVIP